MIALMPEYIILSLIAGAAVAAWLFVRIFDWLGERRLRK